MADIDRLIGFMAIMQVPFMNDPDALMYIEEVKATLKTLKAREWISVKDRLPEEGALVLVAFDVDIGLGETRQVDTAMRQEDVFCGGGLDNYLSFPCEVDVTHWMPLPTPPEEKCNDD